jgi:hypothetical protein
MEYKMFGNLIKISSLLFAISLLGYSCGDDDDNDSNEPKEDGGVDAGDKNKIDDLACTKACKAVSKCAGKYNFDDCYGLYCNQDGWLIVPSTKCLNAIEKASCDEHDTLGIGSYYDICFPSCSEESTSCTKDDTMETCIETGSGDLVSMTVTCESICQSAEESKPYAGVCGKKTATGQVSSTGEDVCWCEE